jgi:hypothetical protein
MRTKDFLGGGTAGGRLEGANHNKNRKGRYTSHLIIVRRGLDPILSDLPMSRTNGNTVNKIGHDLELSTCAHTYTNPVIVIVPGKAVYASTRRIPKIMSKLTLQLVINFTFRYNSSLIGFVFFTILSSIRSSVLPCSILPLITK